VTPPLTPAVLADLEAKLDRAVEAHRAGLLDDAEHAYRDVLEVAPDDPEVLQRLGTVLAARWHDDDEGAEAVALLERAAALSGPVTEQNAGLHNNLGNALRRAGRTGDAEKVLRAIVDARPKQFEAWHNLGQLYKDMMRLDEAAAALRRAIALEPAFAPNHAVLGDVLTKLGRLNAAVAAFGRAIELGYEDHDILNYLAVVHRQLGELDRAEELLRRVVEIVPGSAGANTNLAVVLAQCGRFDESAVHHDRAMEIDPDNIPFIANRAYARLTAGDIPGGWDDWERAIEDGPRGKERTFSVPRWQGEDVSASRVMVYREQGIGDEILFASCIPDLVAASGHTVVECSSRLTSLFARSFPNATVRNQTIDFQGNEHLSEPDFDAAVPMGSLPKFFRPTVAEFPLQRRSFLVADPALVASWRERLASTPAPRVGISWRSKLMTAERRLEYTRLAEWARIFEIPGVSFFNLQYDDCERELADAERRFGVTIHRDDDVDYMNDFENIAALMANLDLVLAPRNAVAMLAGALGVPTVMMGNRWDWSDLGTDTSPWFPSVTLVYRELGQEWDEVLVHAASRVRALTPKQH
jgi:tetratricopeptide (TPR) repeat protein